MKDRVLDARDIIFPSIVNGIYITVILITTIAFPIKIFIGFILIINNMAMYYYYVRLTRAKDLRIYQLLDELDGYDSSYITFEEIEKQKVK